MWKDPRKMNPVCTFWFHLRIKYEKHIYIHWLICSAAQLFLLYLNVSMYGSEISNYTFQVVRNEIKISKVEYLGNQWMDLNQILN